jgi:hypothetical protein
MTPTRLADLASRLPAAWRDALALDGQDPGTPVLWHQGGLALPLLALDELGAWLLYVEGDLHIEGALLASEHDGNAPCNAHLLVGGALHARQALLGPGLVAVADALRVQEMLWGDGAHGRLHVGGALAARWALFSGGYAARWRGPAGVPWLLDHGADPTGYLAEALAAQVRTEGVHGLSGGEGGPQSLLRRDALCTLARAGEALLRAPDAVPGLLPHAPEPGTAIADIVNIAAIRALVHGPLIARRAHRLQDWFGDTDYALCRRHVDAEGDQREDSVFITVWRRWDFYFEAARIERPGGLWGRIAARLGLRDAPLEDELTLLWRRHPAEDGEGTRKAGKAEKAEEWHPLDEAAPLDARTAAHAAWQAVRTHAGEGVAQVRAGHPLWGWLQRSLTPGRVQALARLPVFTGEYNDWHDSDRNGFWEDGVWVGVRQPAQQDRRGRNGAPLALKLGWENGPADAEDNHLASYLLEPDPTHLRITAAQRQDQARAPLAPHSATHLLRLARMFGAMEQRLHEREARRRAEHADAERARALARLQVRSPVPDALPDEAVFGPEAMALSARWQEPMDGVASEGNADAVLQLARAVHRSHDPGLSRRLRERFAFAPQALQAQARAAGQCVGAVFLLDAERVLACVGGQWLLLNGLRHSPLPRLRGAGRSPGGRCWALCEGGEISTRRTLEGPPITRFAWPGTQGCGQLIPCGGGQRVLLRNATGIYLLHPGGVQPLSAPGAATRHAWAALPGGTTVVGHASGDLEARGPLAQKLWHHPVGGAVTAVDASPDGSLLAAGTDNGYVVGLQRREIASPGTSPYEECWRWIFWNGEEPLRW